MDMNQYLTDAFKYFNRHLFKDKLPDCMITVSRRKGAFGYFLPDAYKDENGTTVHELAITPSSLSRSSVESLSTLLHEMVHLWQQEFDKPSPNGYHNKRWANKMIEVGLVPFCISNPMKSYGPKCSHTISEGGVFKPLAEKFVSHHGEIPLQTPKLFFAQTQTVKHRPKVSCACGKSLSLPHNIDVTVTCNECGSEMV